MAKQRSIDLRELINEGISCDFVAKLEEQGYQVDDLRVYFEGSNKKEISEHLARLLQPIILKYIEE